MVHLHPGIWGMAVSTSVAAYALSIIDQHVAVALIAGFGVIFAWYAR